MPSRPGVVRVWLILLAAASGTLSALELQRIGSPLTSEPVLGAPFSGDALLTVDARLRDGARLSQTTTMRMFRDGQGRVRVEQGMDGLPPARTFEERAIRLIVDPDPGDWTVYGLDSLSHTALALPRAIVAYMTGGGRSPIGGATIAVPVGGIRFLSFHRAFDKVDVREAGAGPVESLGRARVSGVEAVGRRATAVVDGMTLTDERWDSPELGLTVRARSSDALNGRLDYELRVTSRREPPPELFELPAGFTVSAGSVDAPWLSLSEPPR